MRVCVTCVVVVCVCSPSAGYLGSIPSCHVLLLAQRNLVYIALVKQGPIFNGLLLAAGCEFGFGLWRPCER